MIVYRVIEAVHELERVVDLEIAVWGVNPRDAVPMNMLHALNHNGSVIIGAYQGEQMVGMALAFPVRRGKKWLLWSHMTGIHPDYQGQGIGLGIKQAQRLWALEHGYDTIRWTFDPLQCGNANFNLHRLGATVDLYHVNFYGEMQDAINAGLPSDRLEAQWSLRDRRVKTLAEGKNPGKVVDALSDEALLLTATRERQPHIKPVDEMRLPYYLVEIPSDLGDLKRESPDLALVWRMAVRQALRGAFENRYKAVDFIALAEGRSAYLLTAPASCFLYVLECNDGSLYTGIAADVGTRLALHNAGRGAAYTAAHRPLKLVAAWRYPDRSQALRAEAAFKQQPRAEKLRYIQQRIPYRKASFVEITA